MSVLARAQITIIVVNDGPTGPTGKRMLTGMVHYQLASTTAPAKPSATAFNFTTRAFTGLTTNWAIDSPVYASGNANKYWYCTYTVEESASGSGTGTPVFGTVKQAIGFSGLVTFTGDQSVSDGTKTLSFGAAGTTKIDGGNIETGTVSADRIDVDNLVVKQAVIGKIQDVAGPLATTAKDDAIAAAASDATTKANNAKTAAENAAKEYADTQLGNFATTVTGDISDLQNQIDGSITTHFYAYVPTTSNAPASGWTTTALKNQHLGDLFYNTATGFCYRYQLVSSVYSWQRITDSDVTKALADAAAAQDTADSKRRVFVNTPVTPYDIGDLWLNNQELYKCKVARATGSYVASDWEKGVKYTDDTVANANLVTAKAYADTKKAEAIAAAEAAAEAEALAAQTAAEAHADGIVTAEEQARIADVNAKLAAAQSYAETKASEAQTAAQNYAATAASNAQSAAQTYALSKANLAETTAKAYADGVVSDEETRAIADATAKMNEAKAHAETKATEAKNAAEAAAALDATAKANAAQSAAESYALAKANLAETTAKAYADGVVDAEEARAIADATAKANAAQAEAKRYAAEIAIAQGGKMLYKDPTFKIGTNGTSRYNNAGGTGTVWERVAKPSDCPSDSTHIMRYSVNGTPYSPGYGGFYFATPTRANAVFIVKIIAKIPTGLTLAFASNAYGTGGVYESLTPIVGTGKYETYYHKVRCGSSGTFSSTNFFFLSGSVAVPFTMDVAFATVYDITLFDDTAEQAASAAATAQTTATNAANAAAAAVTTAASDATTKMNAAKDALAVRLGYTNYAAMAAEAAATGKLIVGGLLNANIIDVQTLVGLEAFLTRLVARNISTTPNAEGWFVRIDDDDPTVFEVRRLVNGVIDANNYIKFGILSSSTPQLLIKWNSANIILDPAGLSVELLGKYVYLSSEGLSVHTPDMTAGVFNQLLTMMKDYIVITKLALSSVATAYSSSYPTMVWKDSKGYLKIGNTGNYTAADVGALPTNTIQYFTQAQWNALSQAQKDAVPLALVQES